jgi:hypothetical protein
VARKWRARRIIKASSSTSTAPQQSAVLTTHLPDVPGGLLRSLEALPLLVHVFIMIRTNDHMIRNVGRSQPLCRFLFRSMIFICCAWNVQCPPQVHRMGRPAVSIGITTPATTSGGACLRRNRHALATASIPPRGGPCPAPTANMNVLRRTDVT